MVREEKGAEALWGEDAEESEWQVNKSSSFIFMDSGMRTPAFISKYLMLNNKWNVENVLVLKQILNIYFPQYLSKTAASGAGNETNKLFFHHLSGFTSI